MPKQRETVPKSYTLNPPSLYPSLTVSPREEKNIEFNIEFNGGVRDEPSLTDLLVVRVSVYVRHLVALVTLLNTKKNRNVNVFSVVRYVNHSTHTRLKCE